MIKSASIMKGTNAHKNRKLIKEINYSARFRNKLTTQTSTFSSQSWRWIIDRLNRKSMDENNSHRSNANNNDERT